MELGHLDVLEHGSLTYDIQGVSRTLTHQLVRHRIAAFSQQSQRYVKVTRSFGYVKPPNIGDQKVPVEIAGKKCELSFEDVVDISRQVEEGFLDLKKSAEDARFIRIGGASTNIVMTTNPREYIHIFNLRCARDAQWEIQDVCYAMLASAKIVAPTIFETLPSAKTDEYIQGRLKKLNEIIADVKITYKNANRGDLIKIPLDDMGLYHQVESYLRKM
jgi:thymidylate synthase (FAD)